MILLYLQSLNQSLKNKIMTKADLIYDIALKTGINKTEVQATVEALMHSISNALETGDNVYMRGFGSFIIKKRAAKLGRNITKNTEILIPAHNVPAFKPAKEFVEAVKLKVK